MLERKKTCLLLGRLPFDEESTREAIGRKDIEVLFGTNMQEVKETFGHAQPDVVIMGSGLDIQDRLEIIEYVFSESKSTTLHMKDWESKQEGMIPFVNRVLNGIDSEKNGREAPL
ncbi:hypothetical protein JYT72_02800 [Crocinitomix catalasitica]|nr:hypothetical protein [Crocinitomix catalasitica]